jgi:GT2 family glycosyltransferase
MQMPLKGTLISVVIPHLNQPDGLAACLDSLDAQTLDRSAFEVLVIDNGSTSPPDSIVARHTNARLLREPMPGPGLARNRGARDAKGDILAFIDADCRAHPNWLQSALQKLSSLPEGTILGGDVQIWRDNSSKPITAIEAYESVFAYRFKLYIEKHDFSGTGNLVVRRRDFEKIGPFAGIDFAEDMEWGRRARSAGFTLRYVPEMVVFHPARHSLGELFVKWDRHLQHFLNMTRGTQAWRLRWIARAVAILGSPIIDVPTLIFTDRISGASARIKASAVLVVVRAYRTWRMINLLLSSKGVVWNRNSAVGSINPE